MNCLKYFYSGVECKDEVYSDRQLEARKAGNVNDHVISTTEEFDTEDTLNPRLLPELILETPSTSNTNDTFDGDNDDDKENPDRNANQNENSERGADCENVVSILEEPKAKRAKPLAVTASIFKSQAVLSQDSRKDLSPVSPSRAPKVSKNTDNRRERPTWYIQVRISLEIFRIINLNKFENRTQLPTFFYIQSLNFQDKPILEYEPSRNCRLQAVRRNLFVPLGSLEDQEIQPQQQYEQSATCRPPPQTATASIFAPRTEDMNKGFLTFSEDQPGLTSEYTTFFFISSKYSLDRMYILRPMY